LQASEEDNTRGTKDKVHRPQRPTQQPSSINSTVLCTDPNGDAIGEYTVARTNSEYTNEDKIDDEMPKLMLIDDATDDEEEGRTAQHSRS